MESFASIGDRDVYKGEAVGKPWLDRLTEMDDVRISPQSLHLWQILVEHTRLLLKIEGGHIPTVRQQLGFFHGNKWQNPNTIIKIEA